MEQNESFEIEKTAEQIWNESVEHTVPLEGRMYDVRLFWQNDNPFIIKRLKDVFPRSIEGYGYDEKNKSEIFQEHREEHQMFVRELGKFVLPTWFISDKNTFLIVQEFVVPGLQYKDSIQKGIIPTHNQLPDLKDRIAFRDGIKRIIEVSRQLPDVDFFISRDPESKKNKLTVFDTTGFYFDKREGKDTDHLLYNLERFLSV